MLENPFKPVTKEEDTDPAANAKLVGEFLGPEAQAAYEKLDQGREGKKGDYQSDLKLTDTEKAVVKEAREKEVWDRAHYIRWAESLGKDEVWVDETFTFYSDGTVGCGNLNLVHITELHEFPQNLLIGGDFYLTDLTSAHGFTFPWWVGGSVSFRSLTSAKDLTLPHTIFINLHLDNLTSAHNLTLTTEIDGDLFLTSLTSADGLIIPEDFNVEGDVYTNPTLLTFFEKLKEEGKIGGRVVVV